MLWCEVSSALDYENYYEADQHVLSVSVSIPALCTRDFELQLTGGGVGGGGGGCK